MRERHVQCCIIQIRRRCGVVMDSLYKHRCVSHYLLANSEGRVRAIFAAWTFARDWLLGNVTLISAKARIGKAHLSSGNIGL